MVRSSRESITGNNRYSVPLTIRITITRISDPKQISLTMIFVTSRNSLRRQPLNIYLRSTTVPLDFSIGLRDRVEGDRQEKQGNGSCEEDLRCLQEPDGCAAHIPWDNVPTVVRQPREHHTTDRSSQGEQRPGHLSRVRVHGWVLSGPKKNSNEGHVPRRFSDFWPETRFGPFPQKPISTRWLRRARSWRTSTRCSSCINCLRRSNTFIRGTWYTETWRWGYKPKRFGGYPSRWNHWHVSLLVSAIERSTQRSLSLQNRWFWLGPIGHSNRRRRRWNLERSGSHGLRGHSLVSCTGDTRCFEKVFRRLVWIRVFM